MSIFNFIASDRPMPEVENPYIQTFSVNEALEKGIEVPEVLLEKADLDRDKKIMLTFDSEEHMGELEIFVVSSFHEAERYTKKAYISEIQWRYTKERGKQLKEYIHQLLEDTNEVELWRTWYDDQAEPIIYRLRESELRLQHIEQVFKNKGFERPEGIVIQKDK